MLIYKVTNKINKKVYIGQTIFSLHKRKQAHKCSMKHGSKYVFHRALRKYGWKNFIWEVIEECDQELLGERETYYIKKFRSRSNANGYNATDGNDNTTLGFRFSDEQKKKLSEKHKGKGNPNYGKGEWMVGENNPAKRKSVRKKISEKTKGRKRPDLVKIRAKNYIVKNLSTEQETEIYNLSEWIRNNPNFNKVGIRNVINGEWNQYKGFHFRRK